MVIPAADPATATGALPPGEHDATWLEIAGRFGTTQHRLDLLQGLKDAIDLLVAAGATKLYLDGSFITEKDRPGDFDGCYEISQPDLTALERTEPVFLDLTYPRTGMKTRFLGELFPAWFIAAMSSSGPTLFRDFFQQDRSGDPKGIVTIDLGGWP
jgi:hypothetical protein